MAYRKGFGESSGSGRAFDAADKDCLGAFGGAGDDIEHLMNPIAEVDIGHPALTVHDFGAARPAVMGVARGILLTQIAFGFGDASADHGAVILADTEDFAAKGPCGVIGILKIEFPTEYQFLASSEGM